MDKLRASEIHADDELKIFVIESVRYSAGKFAGLYHLNASIEPTALLVCMAGDTRLVNLATTDTSLEELEQQVPGLRTLLAKP